VLTSIRARLTAWYAGAFALFELFFAVACYAFVARAAAARVDEELARTAAAVADALDEQQLRGAYAAQGIAAVVGEFRLGDAAVAVLDRRSGAIAVAFQLSAADAGGRPRFAPPAPPNFRALLLAAPPAPALATAETAGAPVRVYTAPYRFGGRVLIVGVSRSLAGQRRTLAEARTALAVGAPLMLLAAVLGGYALARRGLAPVAAMTERATRISAGTLHERLPIADPRDELGRLAAVVNDLLGRLEAAFDRQRRFVADASHELRTPVAIIAGEAELALGAGRRDADALRAALAAVAQEAERLQQIVGDLFLLARADAGERPRASEELYLADLVAEAAQAVRTLAARKGITVTEQADGDLPFRGDEGLLRRLLLNLLDNAIKYTPAGGAVRMTAARRGAEYAVEVADTGSGIPAEQRERVFERFFRGERERGTAVAGTGGGAGLGLAIARWIAEAHGGTLALARSGPDGSTFVVRLPVASGA
jgi:heavy metal sensor kinase